MINRLDGFWPILIFVNVFFEKTKKTLHVMTLFDSF